MVDFASQVTSLETETTGGTTSLCFFGDLFKVHSHYQHSNWSWSLFLCQIGRSQALAVCCDLENPFLSVEQM